MPNLEITELCFQNRGPYTFWVKGGECLGLQGPSGAGKSLLLRAVADLDPRTGTLALGGINADSISAPHWRRMAGLLPAESGWWFDLVGDHFEDFDRVDATMLAELGFDCSVKDWRVSRLSTGERQRLAIARLLHIQPSCLLLDEPTASVDQLAAARVERLLCNYGTTHQAPLLWVSHDPDQLERVCTRRMTMVEGGRLTLPGETADER